MNGQQAREKKWWTADTTTLQNLKLYQIKHYVIKKRQRIEWAADDELWNKR